MIIELPVMKALEDYLIATIANARPPARARAASVGDDQDSERETAASRLSFEDLHQLKYGD